MFCVDMAPCWRFPCHVLAWGVSPSQEGGGGVGQISPGQWDILRVMSRPFLANTVRFGGQMGAIGLRQDQV